MANPSVTYTFTNGNVADASQVNQNFTDLINSLIDGSKSINIDAATIGGLFTANGNVDLGNAAGDSISVTGFVDTNITMKSVDAGAAAGPDLIIDRDSASAADGDAIGRVIFRGNDDAGTPADNDYASIEASIVDSGAGSEDGKLEFKTCAAGTNAARITLSSDTATIAPLTTFSTGISLPSTGATASNLTFYAEASSNLTFTANSSGATATNTVSYVRVGRMLTLILPAMDWDVNGSDVVITSGQLPSWACPSSEVWSIHLPIKAGSPSQLATPGMIRVKTTGEILLYRDGTAGAALDGTAGYFGVTAATTFSYLT